MKINKEFILKNLMTIICGITIIALFMPFIGVDASVSVGGFGASSGEQTIIGYSIITEGGFLGILMELCIVIIIASAYIPQLKQYRKIACAASSVIGLICLFIVPASISSSISAAGSGGGASAKVDVSYKLGFWIMLICYIALIAMSVIQFLGLKGNKLFDTINGDSASGSNANASSNGGVPNIGFNADKIKGMAQNAASNISNAASGIKNQVSEKMSQLNNTSNNGANSQPNSNYRQQAAQPQQYAPIQQTTSIQQDPPIQKGDPEEIMKQIKSLHEMKEAGILTEEEFAEKKQEFLKKI